MSDDWDYQEERQEGDAPFGPDAWQDETPEPSVLKWSSDLCGERM